MSKRGHRPQRICLGCGNRDDQHRLIRLSLTDDRKLVVDPTGGRGGYLHRSRDCWQTFLGRKGSYRAFRVEISRAEKERLIQELKDRDWE